MAERFLSPLQRKRIQQAIRDGHLAFAVELFGPTAVAHEDYERLLVAGKIRNEKLLPQDAAHAVHTLGAVIGEEQVSALARMRHEGIREDVADVHGLPAPAAARIFDVEKPNLTTPESFWRQVRDDHQVITEAEREAVSLLRDRIGQYVRGLGDKLDAAVGHALVDADQKLRRKRLTALQRETVRGVLERESAREVAKRLREITKDMKKDWFRAVHTEMHNAVEEAKAIVIAHRGPERDPRVFKRPRPTACAYCKLLYLKPDGVTPRVFKLSDLLANGTNVGRKANRPSLSGKARTEWKAVLGAAHPFCCCALHVMPPGHGFDKNGKLVSGVKKSEPVEVLDKELAKHECEP